VFGKSVAVSAKARLGVLQIAILWGGKNKRSPLK
jgi:hypothetical protein